MRKWPLWGLIFLSIVVGATWLWGMAYPLKVDWESAGRRPIPQRLDEDESAWLMLRSEYGRFVFDYRYEDAGAIPPYRIPGWPDVKETSEDKSGTNWIKTGWPRVPKGLNFSYSGYGVLVLIDGGFRQSVHISFSGWMLLIVVSIYPVIVFLLWPLRRRKRRRAGYCQTCGYDLTANTTGVCPECGTEVMALNSQTDQTRSADTKSS